MGKEKQEEMSPRRPDAQLVQPRAARLRIPLGDAHLVRVLDECIISSNLDIDSFCGWVFHAWIIVSISDLENRMHSGGTAFRC